MLSVGDIAKETGLSRQRIWQLAVTERLPAKRFNPGGKQHRFYDSAEFAAWRKRKKAALRRATPSVQVSRAVRVGRRRAKKIQNLLEIFENKTEVREVEKEEALQYLDTLVFFIMSKQGLADLYGGPRPLLEGIHALYESKFFAGETGLDRFNYLFEEIKKLPTRSASSRRRSSVASD